MKFAHKLLYHCDELTLTGWVISQRLLGDAFVEAPFHGQNLVRRTKFALILIKRGTSPSSSTARQRQNCLPAMTTAISSRCHRDVGRGVPRPVPARTTARTCRPVVLVIDGPEAGRRKAAGDRNQPIHSMCGSLRGTGAAGAFGQPTMMGATGTQSAGRPSAALPCAVLR